MSTSRLADRQIRAAAQRAALRLDVRGPVSKALGEAGITIQPDDLEAVDLDAPVPVPSAAPGTGLENAPAKTAGRPRGRTRGLEPTRKPFASEPWPTREPATSRSDAPKALSGLTADERRVHRILLDALARENGRDGLSNGLSFAEKKYLPVLDLGFIDKELASMEKRRASSVSTGTLVGLMSIMLVPVLALTSDALGLTGAVLIAALTGAIALAVYFVSSVAASSSKAGAREQIYRALREIAVLVDDAPVSDALERADALIDHFAGDPASRPALSEAEGSASSRPPRRAHTHS